MSKPSKKKRAEKAKKRDGKKFMGADELVLAGKKPPNSPYQGKILKWGSTTAPKGMYHRRFIAAGENTDDFVEDFTRPRP